MDGLWWLIVGVVVSVSVVVWVAHKLPTWFQDKVEDTVDEVDKVIDKTKDFLKK